METNGANLNRSRMYEKRARFGGETTADLRLGGFSSALVPMMVVNYRTEGNNLDVSYTAANTDHQGPQADSGEYRICWWGNARCTEMKM